jgi:hypothetical protein
MKSKSTASNLVTYLDAIAPLVYTQRQVDSIYFDFSNAFDRAPHETLLRKLNDCGLSAGYISWFRSYLTNRTSYVRYCDMLSSSYKVLSGVPQGFILGPLLFNIFSNDLCGVVKYSNCLLFADDIKIFREIKSPHDSFLLQSDINCVHGWCISDFMKLNVNKTRVITFSRKMNLCLFDYKLCELLITQTECIKDLGVQIDSKLHFHHHVDYIFSQANRLLGLIRTVTFSFSSLQSLLMLCYTVVRPKLEYVSVAWNSITSTDASELERIQRKFAFLCHCRPFFFSITYRTVTLMF